METLGTKNLSVDKIVITEKGFKARLKQDHVKRLAESISESVLLHEPTVRKVGNEYRVIAGRDRIAAHMVLGRKHVPVKVLECTDDEAFRLEREENIRRRNDPEKARQAEQELLDHFTKEAEALPEDARKTGRGPAKSSRRVAREKLAEVKGVKPESVKRAEQRNRKRKERAEAKKAAAILPPEPPVLALGIDLGDQWCSEVAEAKDRFEQATALLRKARDLLKLQAETKGLFAERAVQLFQRINELGQAMRDATPYSVCPYCKVMDHVMEKCGACEGEGVIGFGQKADVADHLWKEGDDAVITYLGKEYRVADYEWPPPKAGAEPKPKGGAKPAKPAAKKGGKKSFLDALE